MRMHEVQSVELGVATARAFRFIADARELPRWTDAFAEVRSDRAVMRTANGEVEVGLRVAADASAGTVDWRMTFEGGAEAQAFSRVTPIDAQRCVYTFVLMAPPVPLEQLEGALEQQSRTLAAELVRLKRLLESRAE